MLRVTPDESGRFVVLEPVEALSEGDFKAAASTIDPLIRSGTLNGLIIHTKHFPGWDSFRALVSHLRFVRDHHKQLRRVAIVTDSRLGDIGEGLASHFVSADIKHFPFDDLESAESWINSA